MKSNKIRSEQDLKTKKRFNINCVVCGGYEASYLYAEIYKKDTEYGIRSFVKCVVCGGDAQIQGEVCSISYMKPQIKGFFQYKGENIPVDKNGDVVDRKDNPYENDQRGWKRAGHKDTSGYERGVVFR